MHPPPETATEQHSLPAQKLPGWIKVLFAFPLIAFGGFVTVMTTTFLSLYMVSRIGGGPRAPGLLAGCLFWLFFGVMPLALGKWMLGNFSKAPFSRRLCLTVLLLVLVLSS